MSLYCCPANHYQQMLSSFLSLLFLHINNAFPDSASPIMVVPSMDPPANQPNCIVTILTANCSSYDQVSSQLLEIPPECSGPWSQILMKFHASEKGTQFDRVGAVWIGDIEVLRTTTPEPTATGIEWNIVKDLTLYSQYFKEPNQALYTSLSIPNNVDSTYTGIIEVEISLAFYNDESGKDAPTVTDVLPLTRAPSSSAFPWDVMTVVGNQSLSYSVTLSDIYSDLFLEVFASGHGCEEFYYSNLPGNEAASMGICGNGVYREIQVFVDGKLAGAVYPFPVIYSGGINPFLWRPLAGTMSFSIPSHRFDISPFLHLFSDGLAHTISVTVYGNNQDDGGFWYLDATLLGSRHFVSQFRPLTLESVIVTSELLLYDSGVHEKVVRVHEMNLLDHESNDDSTGNGITTIRFQTTGFHLFNASRIVSYSNGTTIKNIVSGKLSLVNNNSYVGSTTGITFQQTINSVSSERAEEHAVDALDGSTKKIAKGRKFIAVTADYFPLDVKSFYNENATTMDIEATVNFSYNRIKLWSTNNIELDNPFSSRFISKNSDNIYVLQWNDALESKAAYNRSLDHATVYVESDTARERFRISSDGKQEACYNRLTGANDGFFTHDTTVSDDCNLPEGLRLCEYDLCGPLSMTGVQDVLATLRGPGTSPDESNFWSHYFDNIFPIEFVFSSSNVRQFMEMIPTIFRDISAREEESYLARDVASPKSAPVTRPILPSDLVVKVRNARRKNP